jgi:hypothetical protein
MAEMPTRAKYGRRNVLKTGVEEEIVWETEKLPKIRRKKPRKRILPKCGNRLKIK